MVNINFDQIVIYGPYLFEHENSWLFYGLYKAFQYKRYKVIYINSERKNLLNNYDLSNSLFITDGIHDEDIPLREDSFYLLFENNNPKYNNYNKLNIGIYKKNLGNHLKEWKNKFYIKYSLETKELYFPLATELLPEEILDNQQKHILYHNDINKLICILDNPTNNSLLFGNIKKISFNNYYQLCLINSFSIKKRQDAIKKCLITPILHSEEQINNDEINEKLFQAISYGGFPVTNSKMVADMFDNRFIYYGETAEDLIFKGIQHKKDCFDDMCKWHLMEQIKNEHTYVKRVELILWILLRL